MQEWTNQLIAMPGNILEGGRQIGKIGKGVGGFQWRRCSFSEVGSPTCEFQSVLLPLLPEFAETMSDVGVGGEVAGDQHAVVEELDDLIPHPLQDVVEARFKSHRLRHTFPFHGCLCVMTVKCVVQRVAEKRRMLPNALTNQ